MRRIFAMLCICALACGLFACGQGRGEAYQPKYDGAAVPVVKSDVAASKEVTFQGFLDILEQQHNAAFQPLENSRVVSREQSYRGHWYRIVYYAYPKFTNELSGDAARSIKAYYKQQYKSCTALEELDWLQDAATLPDNASSAVEYRMQLYGVTLLEDYAAVLFRTSTLLNAQHRSVSTADVFSRTTGKRLALEDVADTQANAEAINKAVADYLRIQDIRPHKAFDIQAVQQQMFSVAQEGLLLLFAPGELAPEIYGSQEITVPWEAIEA